MLGIARRGLPWVMLLALGPLAALATGCGSSGGGSILPPAITAGFTASGTAPTANLVFLRQGSATGDLVTVQVAIAGTTTSSDLYSFAFDLVLSDPTVATYQSGSATFGTALTLSGGQTSSVLVTQSGNRLVIGVTKLGGGAGNGVGAAQPTVVSLVFQVLKVGSTNITFSGPPPGGSPAALDSGGATVASVTFDAAAAQITGQ
jgi:hypothetical protein